LASGIVEKEGWMEDSEGNRKKPKNRERTIFSNLKRVAVHYYGEFK